MPIFRVHHNNNYTVVSNTILRDKNLSLKTIGLLCKILSLPEGWDFSEAGLSEICKDGITTVRTALKEMENFGYLIRGPVRENNRIVDWKYDFYEEPQLKRLESENLKLENLSLENLSLENTHNKINNNKLNNNKLNNNKEDIYTQEIHEIIDYLNFKLNSNYRYNSKGNNKFIIDRLKENYTVEDFKKVIDNKCLEWLKDEKMCKYLRPETLFGNKFDAYLNAVSAEKKKFGVDSQPNPYKKDNTIYHFTH